MTRTNRWKPSEIDAGWMSRYGVEGGAGGTGNAGWMVEVHMDSWRRVWLDGG